MEVLLAQQEPENPHDRYAVCILKSSKVMEAQSLVNYWAQKMWEGLGSSTSVQVHRFRENGNKDERDSTSEELA